jgi:hypothetical protein
MVLEDNISKVEKEVIVLDGPGGHHIQGKKRSHSPAWVVLEDNISKVRKEVIVLGSPGGQHIHGKKRSHSPGKSWRATYPR